MLTSLKKLNRILDSQDIRSLAVLLFFIGLASILEVTGIFSVLPFMQIAATPESVENNSWLSWVKASAGFEDTRTMIIWIGIAVLLINLLTAIVNVLTNWMINRSVWQIAHRIGVRLMHRYTRLPFEFFLEHNSAGLVKKATADIHALVSGVLLSGCQFIAHLVKSLVILLLLFAVNPQLALMAFLIFGAVYLMLHFARHNYLQKLGEARLEAISQRITTFTQTLAGTKSLRVNGATEQFVNRFDAASLNYSAIQPKLVLSNLIPKHGIELIAVAGIIGTVIYVLRSGIELINVVPTLSVFAMASYKLLPSLSKAFAQAANLSHNLPVIEVFDEEMQRDRPLLPPMEKVRLAGPMSFNEQIEVSKLCYRYRLNERAVLEDIQLKIQAGERIALVGSTGCGKSTLIDLMAGLLFPQAGQILVDGQPVNVENVFSWQKILSYVPQDIFLCDDTVSANIALGVPQNEIDSELLKRAAELSQSDQFVMSDLPEGYETRVGERGVRLSGGQRQRIGLARAFYRQPKLMLLDEATSALDNVTEERVISAIANDLPGTTVVMVAHRLSTVKFCDKIFVLDQGKIVDCGTYQRLIEQNDQFRTMVELAELDAP